jgi:hypothetical protein
MTLYNAEQAVQIPTQRVEVAQSIRVINYVIHQSAMSLPCESHVSCGRWLIG